MTNNHKNAIVINTNYDTNMTEHLSQAPDPSEVVPDFHVETLVAAELPECRAYTIDGIPTPDLDQLSSTYDKSNSTFPSIRFILHQSGEYELEPDYDGTIHDKTMPGVESLAAWAKASIQALDMEIPPSGLHFAPVLDFLEGPTDYEQSSNYLHIDGNVGTLTVFENDTTVVGDEAFQDVYPKGTVDPGENGIEVSELMHLLHQTGDARAHIRRPNPNQTMFIGPECLHAPPQFKEGTIRRGVFCFVSENL